MHFYYLDEAGCTGADINNEQQPTFVLGGISVRDEGWNKTQECLAKKLSDYFGGNVPENFELHAEELLSPNGNGPFLGHDRERRNQLTKEVLSLLNSRSHDVHLFAIDKQKLANGVCSIPVNYNLRIPYLVAYDYLLTHINWFVKARLGRSARGMLIIDAKEQFHSEIEAITRYRRFEDTMANRVKWIVEFSYPVDSRKNPMVQLSDLVVFCAKKFLEIESGYRDNYSDEAKRFFAECYEIIDNRNPKKTLVSRAGRNMNHLNNYLNGVHAKPSRQWKRKYHLV
jgi:hypothetical protein